MTGACIVRNPKILGGKPTIEGTRISAELVLRALANGMSEGEIREQWPTIPQGGVAACLAYAADLVENDRSWAESA